MAHKYKMVTVLGATVVAAIAWALLVVAPAAAATPRVLAIRFGPDLEVNPVTKDYLNHQLDEAAKHYDAAVIELDTPGGLSSSLREIYQKELSLSPGDRLRHAERRPRRLGRGLDRRGRRRARDVARSRTSAPRRRSTRAAQTSAPTCAGR